MLIKCRKAELIHNLMYCLSGFRAHYLDLGEAIGTVQKAFNLFDSCCWHSWGLPTFFRNWGTILDRKNLRFPCTDQPA